MEENNVNKSSFPMAKLSKEILKQRQEIEDKSFQMVCDLQDYLKIYFERVNKKKICFEKPYKLRTSSIISSKYNVHTIKMDDNEFILECDDTFGCSKNINLTQLTALEQAKLFDYIMAEISKNTIYVVLEERYIDQIEVSVIGTFKTLEKAKECFTERINNQQDEYPCIWEEGSYTDTLGYKNEDYEYNICGDRHYYNIKIVEQEIK